MQTLATPRHTVQRLRPSCRAFATILALLSDSLIPQAKDAESKVFYHKMKGDYFRYIAEFTEGDKKSGAANSAKAAYDDAMGAASELAVTHPIRLGLALNFSV